ncbi:hypothetical protein GOP47_0025619 [Adiantum capillus-veneris]|uniref:Uncharacterized protein n=1 Tax=Adiantum capillus-veneris TaxID=13818 RepID=A0A9D4U0W0_ADICA|nr:hypothetical protein GOP47_0025619 [Adiantum capillus-veneris]
MENLTQLAKSMWQEAAMLSEKDPDDSSQPSSGFLSLLLKGMGDGTSVVLSSLTSHPVLPTTGESVATRIENNSQQVSARGWEIMPGIQNWMCLMS